MVEVRIPKDMKEDRKYKANSADLGYFYHLPLDCGRPCSDRCPVKQITSLPQEEKCIIEFRGEADTAGLGYT